MTPEREEYFANISEEERIARELIDIKKASIALRKFTLGASWLTPKAKDILKKKKSIQEDKKTISSLKKHLAVRVLNQHEEYSFQSDDEETVGECPRCHEKVRFVYHLSCCGYCGQKLRWTGWEQ